MLVESESHLWQIPDRGRLMNGQRAPEEPTLLERLGLEANPFEFANAEEELRHSPYWRVSPDPQETQPMLRFFDFFFFPPLKPLRTGESLPDKGSWFDWLLCPRSMAFLGEPGSGKSMIRLAFEAWVRTRRDLFLVSTITLKPGQPVEQAIWENLQVDFVIQFLEKFAWLQEREKVRAVLEALLARASGGYKRWLERIVHKGAQMEDLGIFWPAQNRPIVQRVTVYPEAILLLKTVLQEIASRPAPSEEGAKNLKNMFSLIHQAGFPRIFLQVEIPDDTPESREALMRFVERVPLEAKGEFTRLYLPATFRDWVEEQQTKYLNFAAFLVQWNTETLHRMLLHRARASGGILARIGEMADPRWREKFEARLWQESRGNPRAAMQLLNLVLHNHQTHPLRAREPYLQPEDWPSPNNN